MSSAPSSKDVVPTSTSRSSSNNLSSPSVQQLYSYSLPSHDSSSSCDRPGRRSKLPRDSGRRYVSDHETFRALLTFPQGACLLLIGVQTGLLICWANNRLTKAALPSAVLSFVAGIAILFLSRLEDSRAVRPSSLLSIYLLVSLAFDAVQTRTLYLKHVSSLILGLFTANVGIKLVLLLLENRSKRSYLKSPYNVYPPEATSGIVNRSFFWWITPVFATGFRKLLTLNDLFTTDPGLLSEPLLTQMEISWKKCKSLTLQLGKLLTPLR